MVTIEEFDDDDVIKSKVEFVVSASNAAEEALLDLKGKYASMEEDEMMMMM